MKFRFYPLVLAALLAIQSCSDDDGPSVIDQEKDAIETYAAIVYATYEDSYTTAATLKQKIDAFIAAPSNDGLQQCKTAWLAARLPYGQTEAFRFYGGPIDNEDEEAGPLGPEGLINAWPMDENFIDYTEGAPDAGLINNPDEYPTISKEVLLDLNESISETSIFTGYHAIEFLLWGQDLNADGPGARPYTDYVVGEDGTADNQQRRGQYLKVVADLLLENLATVRDAWAPGATYRSAFVSNTDVHVVLGQIFTGIGELSKGELAGERMTVAVEEHDQENEHSCFSDNTHNDIKMNFLGVRNVYYGAYLRTSGLTLTGVSFADIARSIDSGKTDAVEDALEDAEAKIDLIPVPFDQAILAENVASNDKVWDAIDALSDLSDYIADVALTLGAEFD